MRSHPAVVASIGPGAVPNMDVFHMDDDKDKVVASPFPFLRLPAEIRNMVYGFSFPAVVFSWEQTRTFYLAGELRLNATAHNRREIQQPALVRACRQTRTEGRAVFYHLRRFEIVICDQWAPSSPFEHAIGWLSRLDASLLAQMRHFNLDITSLKATFKEEYGPIHDLLPRSCTIKYFCRSEFGLEGLEPLISLFSTENRGDREKYLTLEVNGFLVPWNEREMAEIHQELKDCGLGRGYCFALVAVFAPLKLESL